MSATSILVLGWSPTPQVVVDAGLKQAPFTELHVILEQESGRVVLRFKTRKSVMAFVSDLLTEADHVWPEVSR